MAVERLSQASIGTLNKYSSMMAGSAYLTDFQLISTVTIASSGTNATFTSIPSGYRHLQVRVVGRATSNSSFFLYINGDFGANYTAHDLRGNGTSVTSAAYLSQGGAGVQDMFPLSTDTAAQFGAAIADVLDYSQTTKNKTIRFMGGYKSTGGTRVNMASAFWNNTAAITQILVAGGNGFDAGSRISLYGWN